jgi:hypothetical protein
MFNIKGKSMKRLILSLTLALISGSALAVEPLTSDQKLELELILAEAASKLIYIDRDCDMPVDKTKIPDLAKIKAFSEGYYTVEGISWENTKREAHKRYGALKIDAPMGELCAEYIEHFKDGYKFLKDIDAK